ncbi:MAG: phage terminase large subunit [Clostridia bacterium]|nr:phage terminase large subunit [Clostridia bacterium]
MGNVNLTLSSPSEKQKLFLLSDKTYTAFGGARGGGKSWAVRTKAILLALNYSGIKIMIVRKTYPELRANHINQLCSICVEVASYTESRREMKFFNGSTIKFSYCRNVSDLDKFQGIEADIVFIDEATQFSREMFDRIRACVRGVNSFPKRIYLTCNPGGIGHSWVKDLFIDGKCDDPLDYQFIRSIVTDNKALMESDPDYIKKLEALPSKLKKAWLDGDWDIFEGQFFEEFRDVPEHYKDRRFTHVIEPFEIPKSWKIYRSFDFGYSKPFSCDWWAIDYDGRAYLILQLYGATEANVGIKWPPNKIFSEIAKIEKEHRWLAGKEIFGVADPSIWDASRGEAIIDTADKYRVFFQKGDNKRIAGWMQCHYRLAFDDEGKPMVYFFNTCKNAIRTLPLLTYSDTSPEDLNTAEEDHFADSFRYFAMSRPITPKVPETYKTNVYDDPLSTQKKRFSPYTY